MRRLLFERLRVGIIKTLVSILRDSIGPVTVN